MTYKNTGDHTPPPRWHLSLTFSAPSCESPPLYRQPGLRRAARGNCSSSGACRTARSCPSRARTASPRSSHIWIRRQSAPPGWVGCRLRWPRQAGLGLFWECASVCWGWWNYFPQRKAKLWILFPASASHHQGQRLIIGDMKRSSKCSKEQGVMIGQMACL